MDFSTHLINGPAKIEAIPEGGHEPLEAGVQPQGRASQGSVDDHWVEMLYMIFQSVAAKRRQQMPGSLKNRVRQLCKLAAHKVRPALDKPQLAQLSRQMGLPVRMPLLAHHQAVRVLRQSQKGQAGGKGQAKNLGEQELLARCGTMRQRVLRSDVKQRVGESFQQIEGETQDFKQNTSAAIHNKKLPAVSEDVDENLPEQGKETSDKALDKKRAVNERELDREKVVEKDKRAVRAKEVEPTGALKETAVLPLPKQIDKLHPDFFLGLGSLQGAAEKVAKQAAFREARVVLLVHGPSERVLLNYILKLYGRLHAQVFVWSLAPDESFSDAWFFLRRLKMRYVTLLNLDLGKKEGGWSRLRFVLRKLLAFQDPKKPLLDIEEEDIAALPDGLASTEGMDPWLSLLENQGVFFSGPLDFDFMMLQSFTRIYQTIYKGPVPEPAAEDWRVHLDSWVEGPEGYSKRDARLLGWYQLLMKQQDPEPLHRSALRLLGGMELLHALPEVLLRLVQRVRALTTR